MRRFQIINPFYEFVFNSSLKKGKKNHRMTKQSDIFSFLVLFAFQHPVLRLNWVFWTRLLMYVFLNKIIIKFICVYLFFEIIEKKIIACSHLSMHLRRPCSPFFSFFHLSFIYYYFIIIFYIIFTQYFQIFLNLRLLLWIFSKFLLKTFKTFRILC